MSDNFKRYNCIKTGIRQLLPKRLNANQLKMLDHLAKLINGIIGSGHTQLPKIAAKDPRAIKTESKIKTLKRLVEHEKFTAQLFWLPFVRQFLAGLVKSRADHSITLVMDGSVVGRGCMALVMSLVYAGRALPIAWLVVEGQKGHLGQDLHLQLVEMVQALLPSEAKVTLLGDGEFDGTFLQETVREYGWQWVVRTAKNSVYLSPVSKKWHSFSEWKLRPGSMVVRQRIGFSGEGWGPVTAIGVWDKGFKEPLYLITSLKDAQAATALYLKRFRIETFFSDQKSRGFRLEKSHLDDPEGLNRLLIGCVYAYWWLTYLGTFARQNDWDKVVHRTERCDLSFFQLGWRLLEHWQNIAYPFTFELNLPVQFLF
jgi:hypothetical protein